MILRFFPPLFFVNYCFKTSCSWFSYQIYHRLSIEASNGLEETQDRCVTFLRKFRTYLLKIYNANADDIDKAGSVFLEIKVNSTVSI